MININDLKKINKNVYYMGLIGFLMNFSATLIYTTLSIFIGGDGNILCNNNLVIIRSISEGFGNFAKIFSGIISDKIQNRKIFLFIGYGSMLLIKFCFTITTLKNIFPLLFLQIIFIITQITDRCMNAIRDPARDAILTEFSTVETRGLVFGLRKFITSSGSVFGSIITMVLMYLYFQNYTNTYLYNYILIPPIFAVILFTGYLLENSLIVFLFGVLIFIIGFFVKTISFSTTLYIIALFPIILTTLIIQKKIQEPKKILQKPINFNWQYIKDNYKTKNFINIFILLIIMSLLSFGKLTEFHIFNFGFALGLPKYYTPIMFNILYIVIMLFSYILGYFLDKKYNFLILMISVLSVLLGNYCFAICTTLPLFWAGLILNGIFLASSESIFSSIISYYIPAPSIKATIFGLVYGISGFMSIINSIIIFYFNYLNYDYNTIYAYTCYPIALVLLILIFSYKHLKHSPV
jgi:MFS family permease